MTTATAAPALSQATRASVPRHTNSAVRPQDPSPPTSYPSVYAAEVERDEAWVRQLQEEQRQRFDLQARLIYKEFLEQLDSAGPFASPETRAALQARYDERLEQMRVIQQEELDQHIEMERQERLWSLGLEDEHWDGWNRVLQDQAAILANIQRAASIGAEPSVEERIRENAREAEDVGRKTEEWQRTEDQRVVDRARWAERTRLTNIHVGERRQRDLAEAESQAAHIRAREAYLRETLSESAPSSRPESLFSAAASSTDTPPSSVHGERWRSSPSTSIPTSTDGNRRTFGTDRTTSADDMRGASPTRPSPLSGTPISNTMAHAKGDGSSRPTVWIPPEGAREPTRKSSTFFDNREPVRKASGVFNDPEPRRKPSGLFDGHEPARKSSGSFDTREVPSRKSSGQFGAGMQDDPTRRFYQTTPSSQPQPTQPPNAPRRSAPLPQSSYTPPSQQSQSQSQSQSNPYQTPPRPTTQARTASATNAFSQPWRQETNTPPKAASPQHTTNTRHSPPTSARPTQATRASPAAPPPFAHPASASRYNDSSEDRRRQLREEYTHKEAQRVEEERRRREDEANEKRAEEARRRGAEKRRAEEEARETERREAERKEAERRMRAGMPKGTPMKAVDMAEVWAAYESHWAAMADAMQLRFRSIPWPVPTPVTEPEGLLPVQIAAFVLSPAHSQGKARKDRLKEALLRWHPDRFEAKWLRKVVEEEREAVKEGVGLVVRALNDLLGAEGTFSG